MPKNSEPKLVFRFGSSVKGSPSPGDIDEVELVGVDHNPEEIHTANKHLIRLGLKQLIENPQLFTSVLHEGIYNGERLSEALGLQSFTLYFLDSSPLTKKERTLLTYALRGRDGKSGILSEVNAKILGRAYLIPVAHDSQFLAFIKSWPDVRVTRKRIYLQT